MSDVQATPETTDPSLGARRLAAWVISIILGIGTVSLGIIFFLKTDLSASFPIAFIPEVPLLPLAAIPMSLFFLIWVDYFMGTKIVAD